MKHLRSHTPLFTCQKFSFPPKINKMLTVGYNKTNANNDYSIVISIAQLC